MRDVAHLIPLTQANPIAKIVLDDPQMVPVIPDVGRQVDAIPPADDTLLAEARRPPVNFEHQFIGLDQSRRYGKPLAKLPEEKHESMRTSSVVSKGAVGLHDRTALDRSRDEGDRVLVVPRLSEKRTRGEREECNAEGRKRGHLRAISWAPGVAASVGVIPLAHAVSGPVEEPGTYAVAAPR